MNLIDKLQRYEDITLNVLGVACQISGIFAIAGGFTTHEPKTATLAFAIGVGVYIVGTGIRTMSKIDITKDKPILHAFKKSLIPFKL